MKQANQRKKSGRKSKPELELLTDEIREGAAASHSVFSRILFFIFMVVFVCVVALFAVETMNNKAKAKVATQALAAMEEEERQLNLDNERLEYYMKEEHFSEYLDKYARDELGYIDPRERVYIIHAEE